MIHKQIRFFLKDFPHTPNSLRVAPHIDKPASEMIIDLGRLYHHRYLDNYGQVPPNPNPANFEYAQFVAPTNDLRFRNDGIGSNSPAKKRISEDLGQAFCRWFLHDHVGIVYFAHMSDVLDKSTHPGFEGLRIARIKDGDTPDYLCASSTTRVYLAEAKGRYKSVNFPNKEFQSWREQIQRVEVRDRHYNLRRVKGYIVATRYATENTPKLKTTLYAEDPMTAGERDFNWEENPEAGQAVISLHYASVFEKLGIRLLAAALGQGFVVPEELSFIAALWECLVPPFKGVKFFGGYYPSPGSGSRPRFHWDENLKQFVIVDVDPFDISRQSLTFFGVEEKIARTLARRAYGQGDLRNLPQLEGVDAPRDSAMSALRDGTILAPIEYFRPVTMTPIG